ncbi:MAG: PAS domain-containing hybrid sensor histidine kinase/response regulator [Polyangiales bacterium]
MKKLDPTFAAAIEATQIQAWRWDLATQRVYWTPGLERLFNLEPGSFGGTFDAYLAVIPTEEREAVVLTIKNALETGTPYEIEHRVVLEGGATRWVSCCGNVVCDDHGKPSGMAGVVFDITGRHEAEHQRRLAVEAMHARDRRFRAMVENGSDCIMVVTDDGSIDYASPSYERALGLLLDEIVGRKAIDFVHPDDRDIVVRVRAMPPGSRDFNAFRVRNAAKREWRWLEGSVTSLLDDPAVRGFVNNHRDVTEERAALERLRFQAGVLDAVNEPIIATDPVATVKYWNRAAERLYGYTAEEAVGQNAMALLQNEWSNPADAEAHVVALSTTGSWRGEMSHRTKCGERILVEASTRVLFDEKGVPVAGINVLQDVTAKRRMDEQLRHAQKMEAIGVLAGGVAHDFNNLLAVILGFAQLPLRRLAADSADAAALREVIAAAQRGAELTRKLLAVSRKQIIQRVALDLNEAIRDTAKLLTRIVGEDVEIVVHCAATPLVIHADPVQIEQVVFNLCTNARQAMPNGGKLTIEVRAAEVDHAYLARASWARRGSFAELVVTDTGVGMDESTLARIFEPFFTTKDEGTGLGLATVYGIVQQHGGAVHAESTRGEGTALRVHFPLDGRPSTSAASEAVNDASVPRGRETILVAEDAAPLRALLTSTLSELGYRVIATANGEEAVHAFEEQAHDISLVVLDVVMPKLGALEAYDRMRAIQPDVKALFTTGYAPEATRLADLMNGTSVHVLEKPFSAATLGVWVRRAIDA